jgi:hypothetical protein
MFEVLAELLPRDQKRRRGPLAGSSSFGCFPHGPGLVEELRQRYGEARRAMRPIFRETLREAGGEDPEDVGDEPLAAVDGEPIDRQQTLTGILCLGVARAVAACVDKAGAASVTARTHHIEKSRIRLFGQCHFVAFIPGIRWSASTMTGSDRWSQRRRQLAPVWSDRTHLCASRAQFTSRAAGNAQAVSVVVVRLGKQLEFVDDRKQPLQRGVNHLRTSSTDVEFRRSGWV